MGRIVASQHSRGSRSRVLRIIAGAWRGRRLRFPAAADIRPTPDRVRETLFNWLGPRLPGARCLDVFAGSGVLGLEALSRGAARVRFVERNPEAAGALERVLAQWGALGAEVHTADALQFLRGRAEPFDVVFLDPPFASDLLERAAELLERGGWLAESAAIYVECAASTAVPALPKRWTVLKSKQAGGVGYHLYGRGLNGDSTR